MIFCLTTLPVFAQSIDSFSNSIQYAVTPETPGPNETVHIEMQGISSLLETAAITWQKNGTTVSSGVGNNTFDFITGPLGSRAVIHVIVTSNQGSFSNDFVFTPSVVHLIWEADTTTPLLYKGRALYSGGSTIKVVAFPEIILNKALISSKSLSFQWSLNGTLVPEQSGLGKDSFVFKGDQLKSEEVISVDVFFGNTKMGNGQVTIPATNPFLVEYIRDPLRGELFDLAPSGSVTLLSNEASIQVEPYFFSRTGGAFVYTWTLNGSETTGPDAQQGLLTLRQTGSGSGSAIIGVQLQNVASDQLVQAANTSLQIIFGQASTSLLPRL